MPDTKSKIVLLSDSTISILNAIIYNREVLPPAQMVDKGSVRIVYVYDTYAYMVNKGVLREVRIINSATSELLLIVANVSTGWNNALYFEVKYVSPIGRQALFV